MAIDTSANVWLAIIAICSAIQLAGVITVVVIVSRFLTKASGTLEQGALAIARLEQRTGPIFDQLAVSLNDLRDVAARVKRADDMTQAAIGRVADGWSDVKAVAEMKLWPALAFVRVARNVWSKFARRTTSAANEDIDADARFVYEGGAHARNVR